MKEIGENHWGPNQNDGTGLLYPDNLQFKCSECDVWASFQIQDCVGNPSAAIRSAYSVCPACRQRVQLVLIYEMKIAPEKRRPKKIMAIGVSENHVDIPRFSESMNSRVSDAIESAFRSHNAGRYAEASNGARRALEGLLKTALSDSGNNVGDLKAKRLPQLIELAVQQLDFSKPLKQLSTLVKDGGNLGSHFDFDGDPDQEMTRSQLFLVKYLAEYLYELPVRIGDLEAKLSKL